MLWFKKYLLPGFVFQSVLIGGGYGTGRELVEFFMTTGPVAGYLGMAVSMIIWGLVMAVTYDLARINKSYDYQSFLTNLLGRWSIVYELLFIVTAILVISVMASAAGELSGESIGVEPIIGSITMMLIVISIVFFGTELVEKVFSVWSIALYVVYLILIIVTWKTFSDDIRIAASSALGDTSWFKGGLSYAGYNIAVVPALLYSVRHLDSRSEAIASGLLGGIIGMIPAVFIYTAMLSQYPAITEQSIPANFLMSQLNQPFLNAIFQIILFGTFIETGIGYIHGFNERIAGVYQKNGRQMPRYMRLLVAVFLLIIAVFLANALGLIGLISQGYGMITWGFIAIYVVPVLTVGVFKAARHHAILL